MVDVHLVDLVMSSSMVDVSASGACVKPGKSRVKSVSLGKDSVKPRINRKDVSVCSTMVDVNMDNVGIHSSMVETKTRDGRKFVERTQPLALGTDPCGELLPRIVSLVFVSVVS